MTVPSHNVTTVMTALSLSLSPPARPTAACPQEILHFSSHPHPLSPSAALFFREGGLVHQQQGSVSIEQQVPARWLPRADRGRPELSIVLTGSSPLHFLRVRSAGLKTKKQVGHSKTPGRPPLISGRRSPICGPFDQAPKIC